MLASKSWSIVTQGMFQLREINQMEREMSTEREMCQYLDLVTLREFEDMVKKDFIGQGPYPTYTLPSPSKTTPPPTTNPFPSPPAALAPTPSYGHHYPSPPGPAFPPYSAGPAISHTFMILPTSFSHFHNVHPGVWRIALLIIRYIMAIIIIRIFNPSLLHARFPSHLYLNLLFY
ncbi:hypothetical protein EV424DRAFT_1539979 [Suillus variegatus]|nr:hypothetical protein EV424DRAFT_1539979 [Suillus variegatus]